jgi:hypothetical protein
MTASEPLRVYDDLWRELRAAARQQAWATRQRARHGEAQSDETSASGPEAMDT